MLLTFEYNPKGFVDIHMDEKGREALMRYISRLTTNRKGADHDHLMTAAWGGVELTEELQDSNNILINQVNLNLVSS